MTLHRLASTLTTVAERVEGAVQSRRGRSSIPSREVTLAALALSPRTVIELTDEETEAVESVIAARLSAQQPAVR
jgi:hypothetical protein